MTPEELGELAAQTQETNGKYDHRFHICTATACHSAGSDEVRSALGQLIKERGLTDRCVVKSVGCRGLCTSGPMVSVEPDGILYEHVAAIDASDLVESLGHGAVERIHTRTDVPFFQRQQRVVLEHAGKIDSERI